jgi:hypothetical protein
MSDGEGSRCRAVVVQIKFKIPTGICEELWSQHSKQPPN